MNQTNRITASTPLTEWQILDLAPGTGQASQLLLGGDNWIAATAPGDTYMALHQAGRIPHPFADENETACSWVKDREWWWRTSFKADALAADERALLNFEGLDTYATVWLDGEEIGSSSNMFLPLSIDIGSRLKTGATHVLLLRFTPPALLVANKKMATWPFIADPVKTSKRIFHRKAQFGWGWDWGPDLPTVGIWQPVQLLRQRAAAIADVRFTTLAIAPAASVEVTVTVDAFMQGSGTALQASVKLYAPEGECVAQAQLPVAPGASVVKAQLGVENPRLWWTPELGEAALYRLEVELAQGAQTLATKTLQVGIRSIALDTSPDPDEPGCDFFRFVLNGVPLFARGVNWIPASSFVGALSAQDYARQLGTAAAANINMVRVWGGGLYEPGAFYEACDRLGMLVWQDFMFACAPYPEHDTDLVASVRREVDSQILRLRNHPSLALWCGNNEGQAVHQFVDRISGTSTKYPGDLFFEEIIPAALRELDPTVPYRAGSPYGASKPGGSHNSMRTGDVHNWTVWHGLPPVPDDLPVGGVEHGPEAIAYTRYAEDQARFVSEFGIQASPALSTLQRWMKPDQMALGSAGFLNRVKDKPKDKVNAMVLPVTGLPANLDEYVEYTQLVQAEGLKFGIEHYRRRKPHCSGTLIWQYNDCWPGISWSLIDSEEVRKASWYYVARVYAPVMASFKQLDGDDVELWISNDTLKPLKLGATLRLMNLDGKTHWTEPLTCAVPANASAAVWKGGKDKIAAAPDRVLTVRSPQFDGNRLLFAPFKDLPLSSSEPQAQVRAMEDGSLEVTLTGLSYHHFVRIETQDPAATVSDNYFDLYAGEVRTVLVKASKPLTAANIKVRCYHPRKTDGATA